jgi:phosphohistidine swiveling domain-containing protein
MATRRSNPKMEEISLDLRDYRYQGITSEKIYLVIHKWRISMKNANDPQNRDWNDSLRGDFLWSRNNYGEARPDVMTPLTWSTSKVIYDQSSILPGYSLAGNIGGRFYANISVMYSIVRSMGQNHQAAIKQLEGLLGNVPHDLEIPRIDLSTWTIIKTLPSFIQLAKKEKAGFRKVADFLAENPDRCHELKQRFQSVNNKVELAEIWEFELTPQYLDMIWIVGGGYKPYETSIQLKDQLTQLVGEADTNALLSGLSSDQELLASMGPVVGIAKVARGEMSRQEYLASYGHRCPDEMELVAPRPAEDPTWFDQQLQEYQESPVNVAELIQKQQAEYHKAWERLVKGRPKKAQKMKASIEAIGPAARMREAIRSEMTRFYGLIREWALRAGDLTGLGDDIFFLNIEELLALLRGVDGASAFIPSRKEIYQRYRQLPPYPMIIRGAFDPFQWAADPNRRNDIYDAVTTLPISTSDTIRGFAGAAGCVEGRVHVLNGPEQGDQLQPGEILVAVTTNVGWTPLFPRARAVITDVGAPLSHAAIVARELGIPAVVGCGDATTRLKTGDRVRVDGGAGTVVILPDR